MSMTDSWHVMNKVKRITKAKKKGLKCKIDSRKRRTTMTTDNAMPLQTNSLTLLKIALPCYSTKPMI